MCTFIIVYMYALEMYLCITNIMNIYITASMFANIQACVYILTHTSIMKFSSQRLRTVQNCRGCLQSSFEGRIKHLRHLDTRRKRLSRLDTRRKRLHHLDMRRKRLTEFLQSSEMLTFASEKRSFPCICFKLHSRRGNLLKGRVYHLREVATGVGSSVVGPLILIHLFCIGTSVDPRWSQSIC